MKARAHLHEQKHGPGHEHEHERKQIPAAGTPTSSHPDAQAHQHHAPGASKGSARAHDRHHGHSVEMFRDRFWITLLLSIPTLIWSDMIQAWAGFTAPVFPGSGFIPAILGTAVYFYGGWAFVAGGIRELRDRMPGMMTLISLAITVAFAFSLAVTFGYQG